MTDAPEFTDWIDLKVQRHWYKLREELEDQIRSATDQICGDYDLSVRLQTATIASDGERSVLRVPVSASWRGELEQTVAYILVSSVHEDEPRMAAIGHGIAEALERWVQREVPVAAAPVFLYPEPEVRWPELNEAQGKTVTAPAAEAPAAAEAAEAAAAQEV